MSLLELYVEKNNSPEWQARVKNTSESLYLFGFKSNFRNLLSFEDGFRTYENIVRMSADERSGYIEKSPGQAKSFLGNMMRTKLFMNSDGHSVKSAKGEVYEKFLLERLTPDDRWFLNYMFTADAYFNLEVRYIFAQTDRIIDKWLSAGYTLGQIYNALIYLFNIREGSVEEYLSTEYIIMLVYMDDPGFLAEYRESSEFEKSELHDYIADNYGKGRYNCPVTAKLAPGALTDADAVLDDAKLLFFTHYIANSHPISLEDMLDIFSQVYTRFYKLNVKKVTNFIMMYEDVFRMTYLNLFSDMQDFYVGLRLEEQLLAKTYERPDEDELSKLITESIDYTTTESIDALVKINSVFSANAQLESGYRCELEKENSCTYFTNKATKRPYLEIHQLIPRDYANEFSGSIEKPSNYIALCPNCHRLIHNASDTERFKALAAIYQKRKDRLEDDGIVPSAELLFAVYGIEPERLDPGSGDFEKPLLAEGQKRLAAGGKTKAEIPKSTVKGGARTALKKKLAKKTACANKSAKTEK